MRVTKNLNVSTSQLLTSLVGGLALFLVPQDAKNITNGIFRELYVAGIAALVVVLLFLIFKNYETIGISLVVVMTLTAINYTIYNIQMNMEGPFKLYLDYYDSICFFLVCLIPFLVCIGIRIFSFNAYDLNLFRLEFKNFMKLSTIAFTIYYMILLFAYFLFKEPVDLFSPRDIDLVFIKSNSLNSFQMFQIREYIKNLLYFIPIGFFVTVYKNKTSTLKKIMMVVYFSIFIELVQYVLNTATVSLVDLISYIIGFILGGVIKKLLDMLRKFITRGEECTIFDF